MNSRTLVRWFLTGLPLTTGLQARPFPTSITRIDPPAAPGSVAPGLSRVGNTLALTWIEPVLPGPQSGQAGFPNALRFSRFEKGSWTSPVTIASGGDIFVNWAEIPSVADAGAGKLVAQWTAQPSPDHYDVMLARSEDGGRNWRRIGAANSSATPESGMVSLMPETDAVRAVWLERRESKTGSPGTEDQSMTLRTALVRDRVETDELLDARVCECCQTGAAMTGNGPIVAYRDRSEEEIRDIAIVRQTAKGWSRPRLVAADGWRIDGCPVNGPSVAASGRALAVAWYTAAQERPRVEAAFSSDAGVTFGRPILVDGSGPLGRVDLVLDENGDAIISWAATGAPSPTIRLRRVTPSGRMGKPLAVAPTSAARTVGLPRIGRIGTDLLLTWVETADPPVIRAAVFPLRSLPQR